MTTTISRNTLTVLENGLDIGDDFSLRDDYFYTGFQAEGVFGIDTGADGWALHAGLLEVRDNYEPGDPEYNDLTALLAHAPSVDSMGRGYIFFWRTIQVESA